MKESVETELKHLLKLELGCLTLQFSGKRIVEAIVASRPFANGGSQRIQITAHEQNQRALGGAEVECLQVSREKTECARREMTQMIRCGCDQRVKASFRRRGITITNDGLDGLSAALESSNNLRVTRREKTQSQSRANQRHAVG